MHPEILSEQQRLLLPSKEEAGMEDGNETASRESVTELPLNPVVTCGQDP